MTELKIIANPALRARRENEEIARVAYELWLEECFFGGSPEEALFRAVREVRHDRANSPPRPFGLFVVPKPGKATPSRS
jgi:hypothetical protein